MSGLYVTLEGIDGSGKSTVAQRLHQRLPDAVLTSEPCDDIWVGEAVRTALDDGDTSPVTDTFLFMADRSEHLERVVRPAVEAGRTVISDRGADSTYAYRAHTVSEAGVAYDEGPWAWFDDMLGPWDTEPDLTVQLDVSVDTALERADREEKYETREYLGHVKENYVTLSGVRGDRWEVVDAERPIPDVVRDVETLIRERMDEAVEREVPA